ncbi:MAG: putative metal-binding motif-containing protein, partial [Desulfobacterales bacterium]|nr:putative metal-binding motif-containing protein [Desulfobacterales bacterium]
MINTIQFQSIKKYQLLLYLFLTLVMSGSVRVDPVKANPNISLTSPINNAVENTAYPSFTFNTGISGSSIFRLEIEHSNGVNAFNPPFFTQTCTGATCTITINRPLSPGDYRWNVRDSNGWLSYTDGWGYFTVAPLTTYYGDADGDGFGRSNWTWTGYPPAPAGWVTDSTDCDDGDSTVHPGAVEICGDGVDNDCSGGDLACDSDNDDDGWDENGGDCD